MTIAAAVLLALVAFPSAGLAAPAQASVERVIVVFEDGVTNPRAAASDLTQRHGGAISVVYEHALRGFAAELPAAAVDALAANPLVASVESDQEVHAFAQTVPTGIERIFADDNANLDIDGSDDLRVDVDVAVIDTGIDLDHPDLNVVQSTDCTYSSGGPPFSEYYCDTGGDDDNGHGSHVAGTAAALDNGIGVVGVAPGARLWAVKVLEADGSGSLSGVVAGIDYVTANADQIEVANMSLGCACSSTAMDEAIANSVDAGVTYAVAAGNDDANAVNFSPANHPDVITVSALADFDGEPGGSGSPTCRTDEDDTLASFSNFGSVVEIAAPGVCTYSTVPGGYDTFSGTSMASPHTAGAAALLASNGANPDQIRQTLQAEGSFDWTDDSGDGIKEPLLDVGDEAVFAPATTAGDGGGGGDTNNAPTADFTFSCTDLTCDFTDVSTDSDGTIASWAWDFGDGASSSAQNPSHTYAADGTHTVTLTVTDDDAGTDDASQSVTVSSGDDGATFTLTATGYKVRGLQKADLTWDGANSTKVDVYRDGVVIVTTANDGTHTDAINNRGGGSYTYQVCEAGTTTCSNEVTVSF